VALRNQRDQLICARSNSYACEALQRHEFARNPLLSIVANKADPARSCCLGMLKRRGSGDTLAGVMHACLIIRQVVRARLALFVVPLPRWRSQRVGVD
jgi:hypothetical protein